MKLLLRVRRLVGALAHHALLMTRTGESADMAAHSRERLDLTGLNSALKAKHKLDSLKREHTHDQDQTDRRVDGVGVDDCCS